MLEQHNNIGFIKNENTFEPIEDRDIFAMRAARWPEALMKAVQDNIFTYLIVLKNGEKIHCEGAVVDVDNMDWIHLKGVTSWGDLHKTMLTSFASERGIDIRVSEIAAVADGAG